MEMIDGGKGTQAVVTKTEVWIPSFCSHIECKREAFAVNPLRQAFEDARNQQHMPIFNGTDLFSKDNDRGLVIKLVQATWSDLRKISVQVKEFLHL